MFTAIRKSFIPAILTLSLAIAACGDSDPKERGEREEHSRSGTGKSEAKELAVTPTGKNVDVKMISDSEGERYDPVEVKVKRGDNLRFLLESGVHNVHFTVDKNPKGVKLPPMSEYLQLPGQKLEYLVSWPEGRYYYQCDIHLALGMTGHVTVDDDEQ